MRKLVTIAATALTLSALSFATPAFAGNGAPGGSNGYGQSDHYDGDRGDRGGRGGDHDRGRDHDRGVDRHEGNFDRWSHGGGEQHHDHPRHQRPLSYWQLTRRLERQGYYGVRGLRPSRHGFGWRAFAYTGRGHAVMLRINPYSGRVLNVRYV